MSTTSMLRPNTTQIPNVILDRWMPYLSDAQLRVVLYIVRRTYGFSKDSDAISLKQMSEGIKRKDGTTLDEGTGLSKAGVAKACKELASEKYQVLICEQSVDSRGGDTATTYRLNLERQPPKEKQANKKRNKEEGVHEVDTGEGCPQGGQGGVYKVDTQNPVVQNQEKDISGESSLSPKAKKKKTIKKVSSEEAEALWETLCSTDQHGDSLHKLAELFAETNKKGEVAVSRCWNRIGYRYTQRKDKGDLSDAAWEYGFTQALSHDAPSIGYVIECAQGYRAQPTPLRALPTPTYSPSPDCVIVALATYNRNGTTDLQRFAALARKWDFTSGEEPPWEILREISSDAGERGRYLERIRSIARRAMKEAV